MNNFAKWIFKFIGCLKYEKITFNQFRIYNQPYDKNNSLTMLKVGIAGYGIVGKRRMY